MLSLDPHDKFSAIPAGFLDGWSLVQVILKILPCVQKSKIYIYIHILNQELKLNQEYNLAGKTSLFLDTGSPRFYEM